MNKNELLSKCKLCPRECGVNRLNFCGACGETDTVRIARAELHMWEEPCISGTQGSGTVFFSGCNLRCAFCQNYEISHLSKGFKLTEKELSDTFLRLQKMGAHNINLVNPTHFVPQIICALDLCADKLKIPIVYNSGGYEKSETIALLKDRISIFLPDLKYFDSTTSEKYSSAADYFDRAIKAIRTMTDIAGKPVIDKNGIMQSGVIVRHLILPNHRHDSIAIIEKLSEFFTPNEIMISLMSQYTPIFRAKYFPEINRRVSQFEYKSVVKALEESGFDGYIQQRSSASEEYIPHFFDKKYY